MIDRENVVKALETHTDMDAGCEDCPYCHAGYSACVIYLFHDVLELLKEQPDVVQCEECKHYKDGFCYNPNTYDDVITCGNTAPDWYCADGKRREA